MTTTGTLLIQRSQVQSLLSIEECIDAVEQVFKLRALGKAPAPAILGVHAAQGAFHIKAGILDCGAHYFVSKTNANFPNNKTLHGLPTIQGIIVVSDAENGRLLALIDSIEITIIRTGAATGVAAQYLSRADSKVALICGCGNQGRISLKALLKVRALEKIYAYDIDSSVAEVYANELCKEEDIEVVAISNFTNVARESDIIVTCSPAKKFFLKKEHVRPGTFIAAVGSDNEDKQEIDPQLLKGSKLVVDSISQCAAIGELHHAITDGSMKQADVHAELGEIIADLKEGRTSESEIIVFDSTGTALQDVAAAAIVYEKAVSKEMGMKLNFAG
jgi:alanine dehydrogenase